MVYWSDDNNIAMKCSFTVDVLLENKISGKRCDKKNIEVTVEHPCNSKAGCTNKIHEVFHRYETKYIRYRGFEWVD